MKWSRNTNQGFTLVELIVTLAILAIISSIAVPRFNSAISAFQYTSDFNDLVEKLTLARAQALSLRRSVVLNLNVNNVVVTDVNLAWVSGSNSFYKSSISSLTYLPNGALNSTISVPVSLIVCNAEKNKRRTITVLRSGATSISAEVGGC